jgi:hypothetical protein
MTCAIGTVAALRAATMRSSGWPESWVTQAADDGLGGLDAVVDDQQAQHHVFSELHSYPSVASGL